MRYAYYPLDGKVAFYLSLSCHANVFHGPEFDDQSNRQGRLGFKEMRVWASANDLA